MHLHKGKEFFDQDQLQKAREELEAAYHLRPHDEKVLNMLGMTYYKLEMLPQAEEMYVTLASSNPDIYALQSNLGLIQLKLNKLEQARESLNRALELQPSNSKAHFYMGLLHEKEELWEDALYHFEQANAEKMVLKMQFKMDEARNNPELVLPFEVVEVLPPEEATEPSLSAIIQEEMQRQEQDEADGEITGRMQVRDLAEAMFQIHAEESVQEEPSDHTEHIEMLAKEESDSSAQQAEEEIVQEAPWEKTHPALFPESFGESEPVSPDLNLLTHSAMDEPFLLSDEIAADISTFLAQSRTEESPEQDVFYQEPVVPEFTIVRASEPLDLRSPYEDESDEYRIPTPEEVENEITVEESILVSSPEAIIESVNPVPAEEVVEELSTESPFTTDTHTIPTDDEEQEVNFEFRESDDENLIQQGFLQPSPLTPFMEKETVEKTQDMADTVEPVESEEVIQEAETVLSSRLISIVHPFIKESSADAAEQSLPEEAIIEPEPPEVVVENKVLEESTDSAEEPEVSTEVSEPVEESIHPANLDQFSRDRLYIQPLIGSDRFLLIDPHLLEIIISDKLICRIGTISSYTGNLQFTPWDQNKDSKVPLIHVGGSGIVFLADRRKEIFLISLNNEVIYVESNHLLVAQSGLKIEPQVFHHQGSGASISVSKISGRGTLALTCLTRPLTVNVHEGLPANIPAHAVIAWSGNVVSEVMDDADLRKVMMSTDEDCMFLRFRGTGDVVVEQGGLWGDRRTKRQS